MESADNKVMKSGLSVASYVKISRIGLGRDYPPAAATTPAMISGNDIAIAGKLAPRVIENALGIGLVI